VKRDTPIELDFYQEADNCEKMQQMFKNQQNIKVPKIYRDYSTKCVLTMSFEEGIPLTNFEEVKKSGINLESVNKLLMTAYCKKIFKHGFVHCDPHPVFSRKIVKYREIYW